VYGVWWCAARMTRSIEGAGGVRCMLVQSVCCASGWCMVELCGGTTIHHITGPPNAESLFQQVSKVFFSSHEAKQQPVSYTSSSSLEAGWFTCVCSYMVVYGGVRKCVYVEYGYVWLTHAQAAQVLLSMKRPPLYTFSPCHRKAAHAASARQIRQLWRSKHSYCGAAG
jgi:hypothetical protein